MKKRLFACLLAACLAVSVLVLPASAASLNNSAIQTAITLGAMDTRDVYKRQEQGAVKYIDPREE